MVIDLIGPQRLRLDWTGLIVYGERHVYHTLFVQHAAYIYIYKFLASKHNDWLKSFRGSTVRAHDEVVASEEMSCNHDKGTSFLLHFPSKYHDFPQTSLHILVTPISSHGHHP